MSTQTESATLAQIRKQLAEKIAELEQVKKQPAASGPNFVLNKSGGIYVRHPAVQTNLPWKVACSLGEYPNLVAEITEFTRSKDVNDLRLKILAGVMVKDPSTKQWVEA